MSLIGEGIFYGREITIFRNPRPEWSNRLFVNSVLKKDYRLGREKRLPQWCNHCVGSEMEHCTRILGPHDLGSLSDSTIVGRFLPQLFNIIFVIYHFLFDTGLSL